MRRRLCAHRGRIYSCNLAFAWKENPHRRRDEGTQVALMNAVYVDAGQPLERVLEALLVAGANNRIALAQTTLRGVTCTGQPGTTIGALTSDLRYAPNFTARPQIRVILYQPVGGLWATAESLRGSQWWLATEIRRAWMEGGTAIPAGNGKVERFRNAWSGVEPKWNLVPHQFCWMGVVKGPKYPLGLATPRLRQGHPIRRSHFLRSERCWCQKATNALGSSTTITKQQAKGLQRKFDTQVPTSVKSRLLGAASSVSHLTTTPLRTPCSSPTTAFPQTTLSVAKASTT